LFKLIKTHLESQKTVPYERDVFEDFLEFDFRSFITEPLHTQGDME
jgi:hypothetical protein